jgi:Tfp pilus assembly protein PilV
MPNIILLNRMKKFLQQKNKIQQGFTLVETLVSISIFTLSLVAMMAVLAQGLSNTTYSKQKVIALYLAQENIEYVRNMRDTYVLYDTTSSQNGWNSFLAKITGSGCVSANGCYINSDSLDYANNTKPMTSITLTNCTANCTHLLYDSSNGKYNYTTGVDSGFTRRIKVVQVSVDEVNITSTVSWDQGSGVHSVKFSENLFNWIE